MHRAIPLAAAVAVGSYMILHGQAVHEFLGAMSGAFIATWIRNDRKRIRVMIVDAFESHIKQYHKDS